MPGDAILSITPLGFPWKTADPFLFCVHHVDNYPRGNEQMGPDASLAGRQMGQDFEGRDGWRMYHGETVPGFPHHPHRGFETVTIVRSGYIDHSDSLGATARFGRGDVQWLTAGKGINHSEMFPLVDRENPNPLELFQIWLNLPARSKLVAPYFTMLWRDAIPIVRHTDSDGRATEITVIAGRLGDAAPPPPPPDSWASQPDSDVAIWTIRMDPGARWTMPPAHAGTNRTLNYFSGEGMSVDGRAVRSGQGINVRPEVEIALVNEDAPSEILLLQGRPIGEPVAQHGPFVMNTQEEIQQAFADYRATGFGGWPWPSDFPVHAREEGRFARHGDGREERSED